MHASAFLKGAKKFISLTVLTAVVVSSFANVAFAGDNYTVAGANPGSLPAPGATTVTVPTITLTDTAADDFNDDPTTLRVDISPSFESTVFDQNVLVGNLTIGGTCGYNAANSITYNSTTQADIVVAGGAGCANAETITVAGLKVGTLYSDDAPGGGGQPLVTVDNFSDTPGNTQPTLNFVNLAVTAADAAATVTLANAAVGATQNTTLNLTIPLLVTTTTANDTLLDPGDVITFTMPSHLNVTSAAFSSHTFDGGTFSACSAVAQRILCGIATALTDANGAGTIVLSGITSSYVATDDIADFEINNEGFSAQDIAVDTTMAVTDSTTGALTSTDVGLATTNTNETTIATVTFTNPGSVTIANTDKITVTFPGGFNVSGATGGACSTMDGTITTSVAGQVVTLTRGGGGSAQAAAAESCTINGIINPSTTGDAGTYTILVTTSTNAVRYTDAAVLTDTITTSGGGAGSRSSTTTTDTTETDQTTRDGQTQETSEGTQQDQQTTRDGQTQETSEGTQQGTRDGTSEGTGEPGSEEDEVQGVGPSPFDELVPRDEMVKVALEAFGHGIVEGAVPSFSDSKDSPYAAYIARAEKAGIVEGYRTGLFAPNEPVKRGDALKILLLASGRNLEGNYPKAPFQDVDQSSWLAKYTNYAYYYSIVDGKSSTVFAPNDSLTRDEMAKMVEASLAPQNRSSTASFTQPESTPEAQSAPVEPEPESTPEPQPIVEPANEPEVSENETPVPWSLPSILSGNKTPVIFQDSDNDLFIDSVEKSMGTSSSNRNHHPNDTNKNGIDDAWEKQFKITKTDSDEDADGLYNNLEYLYGTNPLVQDSDSDGFGDGEEVLNLGTDPNNSSDPGSLSFLGVGVTSFDEGQTIGDNQPLIKGVGAPGSTVELFARQGKKQISLGSAMVGANGVYLLKAKTVLQNGEYDLVAQVTASPKASLGVTKANAQAAAKVSRPVKIKINSNLDVEAPEPERLSDQAITDANLLRNLRVEIRDQKPVLVGKTGFRTKVVATWQSVVLTSALIADSASGEFEISASDVFETGDHEVYIQAVRPNDNAMSKSIRVPFKVIQEANAQAPGEAASSATAIPVWVWIGVAVVVVGVGAVLIARRKKV